MITTSQRRMIDSIVAVFETGRLPSDAAYGTVAILADGAGVSYGKHQATAHSSLPALLDEYDRRDGLYAGRLRPYLPLLSQTRALRPSLPTPEWAEHLLELLRAAGADPIMQAVQDELFARAYWVPASSYATAIGLQLALSHLALFDTWIHSGGDRVSSLRRQFPAVPPSAGGDERTWTKEFLHARRRWLASFTSLDVEKQQLVRRTTYRCDALLDLVASGEWDLEPSLTVRGVRIT